MDETTCPRPQRPASARLGDSGSISSIGSAQLTTRHRLDEIIAAIWVATLFLLAHPYGGIRHDAILYTAQALHASYPQNFKHDLFFQFGSQDDWTLYGRFYGALIAHLGIRASNMLGLIAAQALWWIGMWRLTKRLLPTPWHWICLSLVASMPATYGAGLVFSYDEMFLSARLPGEALSLWSIAFMLERRPVVAIATAGLAMAVHPLIGAVGMAVTLAGTIPRANWWRVFLVALPAFALVQYLPLPFLHIHPFDPEWREIARYNGAGLFPSLWPADVWGNACWVIALPAVLSAAEPKEHRRLWSCLTLVGVAGISLSTVADLAGHDAVWIQLQLWRVLWLLTVMQWPALVFLVYRHGRSRASLVWIMVICWLALDIGGGFLALLIAAMLHIEPALTSSGKTGMLFRRLSTPYRIALIIATLAAAVPWLIYQIAWYHVYTAMQKASVAFNQPWLEAIVHTRLAVVLATGMIALNLIPGRMRTPILCLFVTALLGYALVDIDQRDETTKIVEATAGHANLAPFAERVESGEMVYWDGPPEEILFPWILMKTASYFSPWQAAGMIFHRATTFDALHRFSIIKQDIHAGRPQGRRAMDNELIPGPRQAFKPLSSDGIVHVCRVPDVDFVVSRLRYPALSTHDSWAPPNHVTYWLYDCKRIRAMTAE